MYRLYMTSEIKILVIIQEKKSFVLGGELVFFNNKEIFIGNQTIFYKEFFQKGIFLIQSLIRNMANFSLASSEFIQKYEIECNFLNYMQVVSVS